MEWNEYLDWTIEPAKTACEPYDLPWQVVVAQGAIESSWGNSRIGEYNIFGRKYGGYGSYIECNTQEEDESGEWYTIVAKFQDYGSLEEAIGDWCELMNWGDYLRYTEQYHQDHDIEAFVRGIAGIYATDSSYGDKIMQTMKACELI